MKIKLFQAVEAFAAIRAIKEANEMPIKLAWAFGNWADALEPSVKRYEKSRDELAQKHGKPNPENSGEMIVEMANREKFITAMEELNNIEVEVNGQEKLAMADFEAHEIKVPPAASLVGLRVFVQ